MIETLRFCSSKRKMALRRRCFVLCLTAACSVFAFSQGKPAYAKIVGKEVRIGVLLTVDGPWGSYGKKAFRGIRLAVQDVNKAGGIGGVPIKLIEYDNHANIREVPNIIRRLVSVDNVLAIIGPFTSGEGEVGFPIANRLRTPIIAPATAKGGIMKGNRPWAFRTVMPDDRNTAPVIRLVVKKMGIKHAVIFMDVKDAISKYMGLIFWPRLLKELGVKVDTVTFQSGAPSVAAQVSMVKSLNPDAVILASSAGDAAKVAIVLRRQGVTAQLLGAGGLFGEEFIKSGGKSVEGAITAAQFWRANPDPRVQKYIRAIEKRTGEKTVLHEAYGYDIVWILKKAIEKSGATNKPDDLRSDRAKIRKALDGIKFVGASGYHKLDAKTGEVERPLLKATVKNTEWSIEVLKKVSGK